MKEIVQVLGIPFLAVLIVLAIGIPLLKYSCMSSAAQNELEYRWGIFAGCSYKHPDTGLWIPKDNYRAIGD